MIAKVPPEACPTCRKPVPAEGAFRPFCSDRCRLLDLGKWMREEYAVPAPEKASEEE